MIKFRTLILIFCLLVVATTSVIFAIKYESKDSGSVNINYKDPFTISLVDTGEVVFRDEDIEVYTNNESGGVFTLTLKGTKKIASYQVRRDGLPQVAGLFQKAFVAKLGNTELYRGKFWSSLSSQSEPGIVIMDPVMLDPKYLGRLTVYSGYVATSTENKEKINNKAILEHFKELGKLQIMADDVGSPEGMIQNSLPESTDSNENITDTRDLETEISSALKEPQYWQVYVNKKYGYSIKYPNGWNLKEFSDTRAGVAFQSLDIPVKLGTEAISIVVDDKGVKVILNNKDYQRISDKMLSTIENLNVPTKKYSNSKYNFSFSYPATWALEEKSFQDFYEDDGFNTYTGEIIIMTNPKFPKKVYDCCYTPEEVEKYGSKPVISLSVIESLNYPISTETFSPRAKEILSELVAKGYKKEKIEELVSFVPSYGVDTDAQGRQLKKTNWQDVCSSVDLQVINNNYIIKLSGCGEGSGYNVGALFVRGDSLIIKLWDTYSQYSYKGYFDRVLESFNY